LTGNILAYLGDSSQWRKVVVRPLPGVQAAKPGVPEKQWKSLELAIADLMETFGDRYPKGREYLRRLESLRKPHDKITAAAPGKQERLAKITEEFGKLIREPDVDNYDACYLPDGPDPLHLHGPLHSRRLFHMNPDGTAQMEYISSNSYFPNPLSGYTAMPGETVSCVGYHEQQRLVFWNAVLEGQTIGQAHRRAANSTVGVVLETGQLAPPHRLKRRVSPRITRMTRMKTE